MLTFRRVIKSAALFSLAIGTVGCVQYQAKPLDSAPAANSLALPDSSSLRVSAGSIRHPVLAPVTLDFKRGLSPDEAGVLAVLVNPELRAERDQRSAAAAQLLQAGLLPNPQLSANADLPLGADHADSFTAYGIGADWEVTSLITLDAKKRAAAANSAAIELDIAWKEWQIAETAKLAAYDVLALEAQLAAAKEVDEQFAQNLSVVRGAFDRHDKTLLDLSAAEASWQDSRGVVLSQTKELRHQRQVLNRALGVPPATEIKLRDEPLPAATKPPAMDELLPNLSDRRLDLLALKRGYESQEESVRAAVLGQFPKINLGFNGARDTGNVKTIGFGVGIDIPIFDRNQGAIATEQATRQKLFDEYNERVFTARADIAEALDGIAAVNDQIVAAEAALPALERLVKTYQAALQNGNADVLTAYTARTTLAQKQIEILKLRQELTQNWIALEIASGQFISHQSPARGATTQETQR